MRRTATLHRRAIVVAVLLAGVLGWPARGSAQTISGQARVIQSTVAGPLGATTTIVSDTGTLSQPGDARDASQAAGSVASIVSGATLHAATVGSLNQVSSEASIGDVALSLAGNTIGAGFVMARARATRGDAGTGAVSISGLSVNGAPVDVTGQPNQTVWLVGGRLVINEQRVSGSDTTVNALHLIVDGVADLVIASATATVR